MNPQKKVAFYTLGCKLNFSETSTISRNFQDVGYERVEFEEKADIYVINTCSVTDNADKRFKTIVKQALKANPEAFIVAVGCYAQLKPEEISEIEGVDLVLGAAEKFNILHYVDELVGTLKTNAEFARRIGEGELNTEFKPASDNDILGMSLLNMRTNLIENEKRDNERNWIVRGVAEISEILRSHDTIDELGDAVIAYITEKIDAIQGAFYVVNDDDASDRFIEMKSAYAYHKKKYIQANFKFAEGLVGQAAVEKTIF